MSEAITRCPACGTSFRVTEQQLLSAGGSVRCGACLHLFHAEDYLTSPMLDVTELLAIRSDYWQDFDSYMRQVFDSDKRAGLTPEPSDVPVKAAGPGRRKPANLVQITEPGPPSTADGGLQFWSPATEGGTESRDDLQTDSQPMAVKVESFQPGSERYRENPVIPEAELLQEGQKIGGIGSINLRIADEPAIYLADNRRVFSARSLNWLPGILGLSCMLCLQFAFLRIDSLAQEARYRPYYESACHYLPCELPEFDDPELLQIRELMVRSHPTETEALIVDALLRNTGEYRQRFPKLHLQFSDINDNFIADRIFEVSEYLGGEMRGLTFIPGTTEVRLTIEIVDPGERALGYRMSVVSSAGS